MNSGLINTLSFSAPLSLFPPNAIIRLTDDNTTSFLARPAAFGPPLPSTGLNGQLWVGSGFGDDSLRYGIISTSAEGELGCSDAMLDENNNAAQPFDKRGLSKSDTPHSKQSRNAARVAATVDGTDDIIHTLPPDAYSGGNHADIQSIQESAEISGKVVMLSRGGCGFLEKVEWAQRRGGIAVIVADNTRGGPLIQMYARGDTSNVTIPAVFTSHTTAHLLSSLIPPGTYIEDATNKNGRPMLKVKQSKKKKKNQKGKSRSKKTDSRNTASPSAVSNGYTISTRRAAESSVAKPQRRSWLTRLLLGFGLANPAKENVLDWAIVDEWDENEVSANSIKTTTPESSIKGKSATKIPFGDEVVIDGDDWRDPDFISNAGTDSSKSPKAKLKSPIQRYYAPSADADEKKLTAELKGGSVTPGSGEYGNDIPKSRTDSKKQTADKPDTAANLFVDGDGNDSEEPDLDGDEDDDYGHEGLWVTLTQTSGAAPFFDTLLVLVISPLITLTVVYALLLVRSRLRQRRWRAPKSVVERLPVRTYQTVHLNPGNISRQPSPTSSSPSTPLLQNTSSRPRPRSRTTSAISEPSLSRTDSSGLETPKPRRGNEHEKKGDWKTHMSRQVECVVCLEEYVDGVSRVMSLPCGHEFHVDCITTWLTTRRRTCPICKGDVVRSLARGGSSDPRYEPYRDDSDDDEENLQSQVANTMNESLASGLSISPASNRLPTIDDSDIERGVDSPLPSPTTRGSNVGGGGWLSGIAARLGIPSFPITEEDRTR